MGIFSNRKKAATIRSLDELEPMIESGMPVLIDFMRVGCAPCRVMDGIMNELATEYDGSAHVVKLDVTKVPGAAQQFNIRSTPTFVLLGRPTPKKSKKSKKSKKKTSPSSSKVTTRWRANGLIKKDQMTRVLESNGAMRAG